MSINIPLHIADAICKMEEVCYGEGQGGARSLRVNGVDSE